MSERAKAFRERLRPLEWREVDGRPATATELANAAANVFDEMERESGSVAEMVEALREIAKGEGAFSRDPLKHAENCIESMKAIAGAALAKAGIR